MKITRFKLTNIKKHKNLEVKDLSTVFGIIGENGSGKSTILKIIEFAFTGNLPNTQDSWISSGEEWGEVELDFVKNGTKGTIRRRIGKGSSRSLQWEGSDKPITRAAEVDAAMESILGADKTAITNAVFIGQGEVSNVLRGTDSVRHDLFLKLCNLSYIDKHAKVMENHIRNLKSNIEDLSVVCDEAARTRVAAMKQVDILESEINNAVDYNPHIDWINEYNQLQRTKRDLDSEYSSLTGQRLTQKEKLGKLNVSDIAVLEKEIDENEIEVSLKRKDLQNILDAVSKNNNKASLEKRLQNLKSDLASLHEKYSDVSDIDSAKNDLNISELKIAREHLIQAEERESKLKEIDKLKESIDSLYKEFNSLNKPSMSKEAIIILEKEASDLDFDARQTRKYYLTQKEMASGSCSGDPSNCSKCGLKLAPGQEISSETLAKLDELATSKEKKVIELDKIIKKAKEEDSFYDSERKRIEEKISDLTNKTADLKQAISVLTDLNVDDLKETIKNYETLISRYSQYVSAKETIDNDIERTSREIKELGEIDENIQNLIKRECEIESIKVSISELESIIVEKKKLYKSVSDIKSELNSLDSQIKSTRIRIDNVCNQLSEHDKNKPSGFDDSERDLNVVLVEYKEKQKVFNELAGKLSEAKRNYRSASDRYLELQERMLKNENKIKIVKDLETGLNILKREGIPALYISKIFSRVTRLVQNQLQEMETDFIVDMDVNNPVSFIFKRVDKETGETTEWLPMQDLSGGQMVKLSIAFIMAVNRIVLPELNFLVLDEPSTHLDDTVKQSLASYLSDLGKRNNHDSQILVVDHSQILKDAFEKSVTLK